MARERYLNPYTDFGFKRLNREEMANYEESLKVYRDLHNVIDFAEEKAHARGKAEGLAEGMEKGEKRKQLEIARNMKHAGLPIEQISTLTGLPVEEINAL